MTLKDFLFKNPMLLELPFEDNEDGQLDIPKVMNDPLSPYIYSIQVNVEKKWNKEYDQESKCECGHPYYRHFDSYEKMDAIGCKYCECYNFKAQP